MGLFEDVGGWIANPLGGNAGANALTSFVADTPLGGILGLQQNKMAAEQFSEQMKWEKYKFNNAHQAEMNDLKAAGLNPVLTADGGSGNSAGSLTPTASASSGNFGALMSLLSTIVPAISGIKQANAASKLADANATKLTAEAGKIAAETDLSNLEYLLKNKDYLNYDTKLAYEKSKTPLWFAEQIKKMFNTGTNSAAAKEVESKAFDFIPNYTDGAWKSKIKDEKSIQKQLFEAIFKHFIEGLIRE